MSLSDKIYFWCALVSGILFLIGLQTNFMVNVYRETRDNKKETITSLIMLVPFFFLSYLGGLTCMFSVPLTGIYLLSKSFRNG